MPVSTRPAAITVALTAIVIIGGCQERSARGSRQSAVAAGELASGCADDSLRPATAAPAPGLWLYERSTGERVAAMIGPPQPDGRGVVVTRAVESVEVSASGDTIRQRVVAATVSLELLPPLAPVTPTGSIAADSTLGAQPAATYAVSPRIRVAAYEPCAMSTRGPRLRYLRRDASGRIVTDVMLRRASEQ